MPSKPLLLLGCEGGHRGCELLLLLLLDAMVGLGFLCVGLRQNLGWVMGSDPLPVL